MNSLFTKLNTQLRLIHNLLVKVEKGYTFNLTLLCPSHVLFAPCPSVPLHVTAFYNYGLYMDMRLPRVVSAVNVGNAPPCFIKKQTK